MKAELAWIAEDCTDKIALDTSRALWRAAASILFGFGSACSVLQSMVIVQEATQLFQEHGVASYKTACRAQIHGKQQTCVFETARATHLTQASNQPRAVFIMFHLACSSILLLDDHRPSLNLQSIYLGPGSPSSVQAHRVPTPQATSSCDSDWCSTSA